MKNMKDIHNERIKNLKKMATLSIINEKCRQNIENLQSECSHEIVLKFDDKMPHKVGKINNCYCPACGKLESIYGGYEISNTSFKNSKLIDLTRFKESVFTEHLLCILEHIFNNYEKFYNTDIKEDEIAESLLSLIETQNKSENKPKTYKKI